jgi:hypothetical protein
VALSATACGSLRAEALRLLGNTGAVDLVEALDLQWQLRVRFRVSLSDGKSAARKDEQAQHVREMPGVSRVRYSGRELTFDELSALVDEVARAVLADAPAAGVVDRSARCAVVNVRSTGEADRLVELLVGRPNLWGRVTSDHGALAALTRQANLRRFLTGEVHVLVGCLSVVHGVDR